MGDSYKVVTGALSVHSGKLAGLADELRSALEVAGGQNITSEAYGETCRQFTSILDTLASAGRATLQASVESLEAEASKLRATATEYDRQDAHGVQTFDTIGRSLE